MPSITAFPDQVNARVRVEVNWTDIPSVEYAKVLRYNTATGECAPLRPHICFNGDYQLLSCGHGIFFDTEMPLDTEVYYITEGLGAPCVPPAPLLIDTFNRISASTWTVADTGQAYSFSGGLAAAYTVGAGVGTIAISSVSSDRMTFADVGQSDQDAVINLKAFANPTGDGFEKGLVVRVTDGLNHYLTRVQVTTTGSVNLNLSKRVAGVLTSLDTVAVPAISFAGDIMMRTQIVSNVLRSKLWPAGSGEPAAWTLSVTDSSLASGNSAGAFARRQSLNVTPTSTNFDDFTVNGNPCQPCIPVTVDTSADPTVVDSNGQFWLRDPVRPCRDQAVPLCFAQPTNMNADGYCIPANGIFFASMDTEVRRPNTLTVNPTNAKYPLAMARTRRGITSVLTLVTRTFADRDAIITLSEPGTPLFWEGPAAYGIVDQYLDVGDLSFARGLSDHKFQVRIAELPYTQVARPAGPSQGVCGSQVADFCEFTWAELVALGYTWEDLVRGRASLTDYRTWDDVEAEFTDWNDVNDGTRTWTDLEVGD